MNHEPADQEPARAQVDAMAGPVVLEFGTTWCGHCRAAQPLIEAALARRPDVRRIQVEDGSGRRLGRSFAVTLWPTLVFLRDGKERARLVRPREAALIDHALAQIDAAAPPPA